jgi:hypothetical protein
VVCTDSGGLRAYFSSSDVYYVPAYAPIAMRVAVEELAQDDERHWDMVIRAQTRLLSASLTTKGYLRRLLRRIGESHLVLDAYRLVQQSDEPKVLDRLRQNWGSRLIKETLELLYRYPLRSC